MRSPNSLGGTTNQIMISFSSLIANLHEILIIFVRVMHGDTYYNIVIYINHTHTDNTISRIQYCMIRADLFNKRL